MARTIGSSLYSMNTFHCSVGRNGHQPPSVWASQASLWVERLLHSKTRFAQTCIVDPALTKSMRRRV